MSTTVVAVTALAAQFNLILIKFLPIWEGFSSKPYWDHKQWSWGYGTACGFDPNQKPTGTITRAKAMADTLAHLAKDYAYLSKLLRVNLNAKQWAALLSFSYNAGPGNADNLIANINAGDLKALEVQFKSYRMASKKVNQTLVARRAAEWKLWIS